MFTLTGPVTKIVSDACADVTFNEGKEGFVINSDHPVKCVLDEGELTLKSKPGMSGSSIVFGNGSMVFGGGGVSISNGVVSISSGGSRQIYVDGQRIDTGKSKEEKEDKEYSREWRVTTDSKVSRVMVRGSSSLNFPYNVFGKSTTLTVSGSGGIYLRSSVSFDTIKAKLTGSGDVDLGDSTISSFDADLTGSGDIKNFHAKRKRYPYLDWKWRY